MQTVGFHRRQRVSFRHLSEGYDRVQAIAGFDKEGDMVFIFVMPGDQNSFGNVQEKGKAVLLVQDDVVLGGSGSE